MSGKSIHLDMHPIESNIFVQAQEPIDCIVDLDPTISSTTWFTVRIHASQRVCSDSNFDKMIYFCRHEFSHQFDRLLGSVEERKRIVKDTLSAIQIPFSLDVNGENEVDNLFWNEQDSEQESPLPNGLDDVVMRISELAARLIVDTVASSYNRAEMKIWIERISIVRDEEFERLASRPPIVIDGLANDDNEADQEAFNRVVEQSSLESQLVLRAVDESALNGLETLRYEVSSDHDEHDGDDDDDDESKIMTCVICMEETIIGSKFIRMPCFHMFHEDCILRWLKKTNTCPLCV